jgi:hypothetical protein
MNILRRVGLSTTKWLGTAQRLSASQRLIAAQGLTPMYSRRGILAVGELIAMVGLRQRCSYTHCSCSRSSASQAFTAMAISRFEFPLFCAWLSLTGDWVVSRRSKLLTGVVSR